MAANKKMANGMLSIPSGIAAAILRDNHSLLGNLYLVARYYDANGAGYANVADVRNFFRVAGRSMNIVDGLLRDANNSLFFRSYDKATGRLYYYSYAQVARNIEAAFAGTFVSFNLLKASKSKETFNAHIYGVFLQGFFNKPISRGIITKLIGSSKTAQRKWEKELGITVNFNFIEGTATQFLNSDYTIPKDGNGNYLFQPTGKGTILVQTSNSYVAPESIVITPRKAAQKKISRYLSSSEKSREWAQDLNAFHGKFFYDAQTLDTMTPRKMLYVELPEKQSSYNTLLAFSKKNYSQEDQDKANAIIGVTEKMAKYQYGRIEWLEQGKQALAINKQLLHKMTTNKATTIKPVHVTTPTQKVTKDPLLLVAKSATTITIAKKVASVQPMITVQTVNPVEPVATSSNKMTSKVVPGFIFRTRDGEIIRLGEGIEISF